jgi:hypothetical protein
MYKGVECQESFYLFAKDGNFRRTNYMLQASKPFDNIVMFLIAANSMKLAMDTYYIDVDPESIEMRISAVIDYFFNIAFTIECVMKCIALGLIMDEGSYLRDGWNKLDMFIVLTSLTDMLLAGLVEVGAFKILRLLRTLRPLRVISHNVAMKMIVAALFESVGSIFNVMIVVLVVWLMFAILAINLLKGKSMACSLDPYTNGTKDKCNNAGGSWERHDSNWDDVSQALMTLFIVSTLEGWPDVMLNSIDSTKADEGPKYE